MLSASGLLDEVAAALPLADPAGFTQGIEMEVPAGLSAQTTGAYHPESELSSLFLEASVQPLTPAAPLQILPAGDLDAFDAPEMIGRADAAAAIAEPAILEQLLPEQDGVAPVSVDNSDTTDQMVDTLKAGEPPPSVHLTVDEPVATSGDLTVESLTGSGTIEGDVSVSGLCSPGNSPGAQNITGDLTLLPDSVLYIEIGGTEAGTGYDQVSVSGTAFLDGTLSVSLSEGYVPEAGDRFAFLIYGSSSGDFQAFQGLEIGNGLYFDLQRSETQYELVATRITDLPDLQAVVDALLDQIQNGTLAQPYTYTASGDVQLAGILSINAPTLTLDGITYDPLLGWSGSLTVQSGGASLTLGDMLGAVIRDSDADADDFAFTGTFTLNQSGSGSYAFSADRFDLSVPDLLNASATGIALSYSPDAAGSQQIAELDALTITLLPLDNTTSPSTT